MTRTAEIKVSPDHLYSEDLHRRKIAQTLSVPLKSIRSIRLNRRSIDARRKEPLYLLRYEVWLNEERENEVGFQPELKNVEQAEPVVIVGFGPAGMFAALRLIELGLKPIVLERGKEVRPRRRDLAALNKEGVVNPESNYCFGEGGAGTFSDGKLYTRSTKRGDVKRVLDIFVYHGATEEILIDAHPHIGTNKLPKIVQAMRETIRDCGGEVLFETRMDDMEIRDGKMTAVITNKRERIAARAMILATGHSARDVFQLVAKKGLEIEAKPFALGLRVEHPQSIIDQMRYHCSPRHENLPAANYALIQQVEGRGVYSFCMCPGGIICPASTEEGELVVNGWSPSRRDSPYANSGIVVEVKPEDLAPFASEGPFAGIAFQRQVERAAFAAGGGKQVAPAARLTDFVRGKVSTDLPECSYLPGIRPSDLSQVLPAGIHGRLQEGFKAFDRKLRGYLTREAVVVATESRTSSPIRIPRDRESLMHPQAEGFFPCGEGAGYAGGIMSAALDGERCAEAAARLLGREK